MFTPDDEPRNPRLTALMNRSERSQWSVEEDIDWSLPVVVPAGLDRSVYVDMVSQLYYAEEATIEVLTRMIASLPEFAAKQYLCMQAADEARHARVYRRYLDVLGDVRPISPGLAEIFAAAQAYDGPPFGLVAALNVVMEHESLQQQRRRIEMLPCPLFTAINEAIIRDEARHAAFGTIYLRGVLPNATPEDKAAVVEWLASMWELWLEANRDRYVGPGESVLRVEQEELAARGEAITRSLLEIGLLEMTER